MRSAAVLILFLPLVVNARGATVHFGLELSELLQNRFRNPGPENFTLFCGAETERPGINFGLRLLLINVQLSTEHLRQNRFITGDRSALAGRLFVSRLQAELYPVREEFGFLRLIPVFSIGPGYDRTLITADTAAYDLRVFNLSTGFRLQTELLRRVFLELPVIDLAWYLYKNRPTAGTVGNAKINYPEWGAVYFWLNLGVKFKI
jgi:hypothetical protein